MKYYYIDKSGKKHKYVGNVISKNGKLYGVLTKTNIIPTNVELKYNGSSDKVLSSNTTFTFIDEDNIEKPFNTSEYKLEKQDGEFFFIKDIKHNIELKFNPSTDYSEYFTYINPKDKKEYKYENSIIEWRKDLNCYVGKI